MTRIYCDRCGKEIKDNERSAEVEAFYYSCGPMNGRRPLPGLPGDPIGGGRMDLCEKCADELRTFLRPIEEVLS